MNDSSRKPAAPRTHDDADVILVCPHLGDGGAQRVVTTVANAWSRAGRKVCVATLFDAEPSYQLDDAVVHISVRDLMDAEIRNRRSLFAALGWVYRRCHARLELTPLGRMLAAWRISERLGSAWRASRLGQAVHMLSVYLFYFRLGSSLRHVISRSGAPVVMSFVGSSNILTVLACKWLPKRVIISERNDPLRQRLNHPWNGLRRYVYGQADLVTANTRHALDAMADYVEPARLKLIPNPVGPPVAAPVPAVRAEDDSPYILCLGRMHPQKAHDVLLRAFHRLPADLAHWRLVLIGRGELRDHLRQLARELRIDRRITWIEKTDNVWPYYQNASMFVLPSRHEGMSNALMEAMSCGLPVVVTDACPGSLELVEPGKSGLVVPADDDAALAREITVLARAPHRRRQLGAAARERMREFAVPNVLDLWENLAGISRGDGPAGPLTTSAG